MDHTCDAARFDEPDRRTEEFRVKRRTSHEPDVVFEQMLAYLRNTPRYSTEAKMLYLENGMSPTRMNLMEACRLLKEHNPGYMCKVVGFPTPIFQERHSPYTGIWVGWHHNFYVNLAHRFCA